MTDADCLIVGAGPAGLTAAVYLARFRRSVILIDGGRPRAAWIPHTRNYPGFPDGISGEELLDRLREQAARWGVTPRRGWVDRLEREGDKWTAKLGSESLRARRVLLATGVEEAMPESPDLLQAVHSGALRLCPVCDAYEISGRSVAALVRPESAASHLLFLARYTKALTAIVSGQGSLHPQARSQLEAARVQVIEHEVTQVRAENDRALVTLRSGEEMAFDSVYSLLGARSRSELTEAHGARINESGDVQVDAHQRTGVPGLYAAGDVVDALNQLSVAIGHAAVAACAMHNELLSEDR